MFVASFYCYLNYNSKNDFVIDLDNIQKWVGFSRKDHAKTLFTKNFTVDIDYLHGGHNKEQIMMTVNTFKKFFLKASTKKSDEIPI